MGNVITNAGISATQIEFATQTQVNTGTATNVALYPAHVATTANRGTIQIATQAEVTAGTVSNKAIVPSLAIASNTNKGVVRFATASEITTGTATNIAVDPAQLQAKINAIPSPGVPSWATQAQVNAGTATNVMLYPAHVSTTSDRGTIRTATQSEVTAGTLNNVAVAPDTLINAYVNLAGAQTISGAKTFSAALTVNNTITSNNTITGTRLISNIATGTAPLTVTSTTAVTNLNADLLDGQHGTYYNNAANLTGIISESIIQASGITKMIIGTYTGDQAIPSPSGYVNRDINIGVTPKVIMVFDYLGAGTASSTVRGATAITGANASLSNNAGVTSWVDGQSFLGIIPNGFRVANIGGTFSIGLNYNHASFNNFRYIIHY